MLRDIEGQQFSDAVRDKLGPRVSIMGETASLDTFCGFFTGVKLTKGTQVSPAVSFAGPDVLHAAASAARHALQPLPAASAPAASSAVCALPHHLDGILAPFKH